MRNGKKETIMLGIYIYYMLMEKVMETNITEIMGKSPWGQTGP